MAHNLKAKGLYTHRNELTVPDGAMDIADNIIIDEDDVIELRRGQNDYGSALPLADDRIKQLSQYKELIIRHYKEIIQFDDGSGTFTDFVGSYNELETGLRLKSIESNGNFYFTEKTGIKKISASTTSQIFTDSIESAGVPRAVSLDASLKFVDGGFLPPQSKCAYRVLWGKKDNNNNLLIGYPSERFVLTNTSEEISISETFQISYSAKPTNDEYVVFSSNTTGYFLYFDLTGTDDAPETAETLGRVGVKVSILSPSDDDITTASKSANAIAAFSEFNVSVTGSVVTVEVVDGGNVDDVNDFDIAGGGATNITTTPLEQGSVTDGDSSNANIAFSVPAGIDSTYFYQIYRSGFVTVPQGFSLDDIDPGDEMNLTSEGNPVDTSGNLLTEITIEDITPEDFRSAAAFLYTNPISGQGILQANSIPPVAKDIALFNGSSFYANTKTTHRLTFNVVSVLNYTSGISDFIIANEDRKDDYVAIGATRVQDVTVTTNTISGDAFLLESARDERSYFVYFDEDGTSTKPSAAEFDNKVAIRVRYDSGDSTDTIATKAAAMIVSTGDFTVSVLGSVMTISSVKNGNVTDDIRDSVANPTTFTFDAPSTDGDGEDIASGEFLLSNQISVAASIDESARSLVKVINGNSLSPVNAFYLSGASDVPGIILLEARNLEDKTFYIATSDSNIQESFDPSLTLEKAITATTQGTLTNIESVAHNLTTGQKVYIQNLATTPNIVGEFEVTVVGVNNFTIPFETLNDSLNEGEFFLSINSSDNEVSPNRVYFSKSFEPESVPIVNYLDIGPRDKEILRILPLRDNLFALKDDGVYIISGTTAPNFSVRLLDSSVSIIAPDSAVVLNNSIYCLSNDGVVRISDTGVEVISRPIENLIKDVVNSRHDFVNNAFGLSYSSDRSYLLWLPTKTTDTVATQCYRYNTFTRSWTRFTLTATCGLVIDRDDKMYLGDGSRNLINQERKSRDRTDYADRNFTLSTVTSPVDGTNLKINSVTEVEKGDVIVQDQYITISILKTFTKKLDIDSFITSNDYFSSVDSSYGNKMSLNLTLINTKLIADGIAVSPVTFSDDVEIQRDEYNAMIVELNDVSSGTQLKSYKDRSTLTQYESLITQVNVTGNSVDLKFEIPILEGDFELHKGIASEYQYSPQHFGDPTSLKQIRQGTIIFDQNRFYGGTVSYASDQTTDFVDTEFNGNGHGFWGSPSWGEGTWGGLGTDIPFRTLIPLEKQRCRYITVKVNHINAREIVRINGFSLMVRVISNRAYK